jgi:hypothetical protein
MPKGVYPRKPKGTGRTKRRGIPRNGQTAALIHLNRAWTLIMQDVRNGGDLREADMEVKFAIGALERAHE